MELLIDILKQKFRTNTLDNQIISLRWGYMSSLKIVLYIEVVADMIFYLLKEEFVLSILAKVKAKLHNHEIFLLSHRHYS